jgi:hypothetical protein
MAAHGEGELWGLATVSAEQVRGRWTGQKGFMMHDTKNASLRLSASPLENAATQRLLYSE